MIKGVDVSHYETGFDFVKGIKDGIVFMMTKASEGLGIDGTCSLECHKAALAGIKYKGVYHFFHANIDVGLQLATFLKQYKSVQTEMPPILDLEETSVNGRSYSQVKESALQMLTQMESATGRTPILYIDMNVLILTNINNDQRFNRFPRWIAKYSATSPKVAWTFWQFSDRGEQGADTDWFNGTEADLQSFIQKTKVS